jgi:hypothetical protein
VTLVDIVSNSSGMRMVDEDGNEEKLRLLPPATTAELATLEAEIPCPIPLHIRDLLAVTRGFYNGPLESFEFAGLSSGFGMEEIFPHALSLAHDGYGNYWVADLHPDSSDWAPIYFACHDPPVIVFQSPTLEHFVSEFLRSGNPSHESELDTVHETATMKIWRENPGAIPAAAARESSDSSLAAFASTLDDSYLVVDLRHARVGDGFSWGRFGPRTNIVRNDRDPVFAYKTKSRWQRLLGR